MNIAVPPKATAPTVTTKHLAYALAEQHQLSKKQSLEIMEELIGMITNHLKKGERVTIAGLGILEGAETRCPHGPQSGDRRDNSDQGEQKGCLPRHQGTQGGDLIGIA